MYVSKALCCRPNHVCFSAYNYSWKSAAVFFTLVKSKHCSLVKQIIISVVCFTTVSLMWRWGEPCSSTQTQRAVMIHLSLQGIVGDRLAADRLLPWDKSPSLPPSLLPGCLSPGQVTMPTSIGQSLLPPPSPPPSLSLQALLLEKGHF